MGEANMTYPWRVDLTKKADKAKAKLPEAQYYNFEALVKDMRETGPVQGSWPNYSKLASPASLPSQPEMGRVLGSEGQAHSYH